MLPSAIAAADTDRLFWESGKDYSGRDWVRCVPVVAWSVMILAVASVAGGDMQLSMWGRLLALLIIVLIAILVLAEAFGARADVQYVTVSTDGVAITAWVAKHVGGRYQKREFEFGWGDVQSIGIYDFGGEEVDRSGIQIRMRVAGDVSREIKIDLESEASAKAFAVRAMAIRAAATQT